MTAKVVHFCVTLFTVSAVALCIAANSAPSSGHNNPQAAEVVPPHPKDHQGTVLDDSSLPPLVQQPAQQLPYSSAFDEVVADLSPPPPGMCIWYNSRDQVVVEEQRSCSMCIQQCNVEPKCKAAVYVFYRAARISICVDATACQQTEATSQYSAEVGPTLKVPVALNPSSSPHSLGGVLPTSSTKAAPMLPIAPPLKHMTSTTTFNTALEGSRRELTAVTQSPESPGVSSPFVSPQTSPTMSPPQPPLQAPSPQPPPSAPTLFPSSHTTPSPTQSPVESSGTNLLLARALRSVVASGTTGDAPPPPSSPCALQGCVAIGWVHTCAVTTTGKLGCWGNNDYGQIDVPADFSSNIASVSAGNLHTCAVTTTGRLGCWGDDDDGRIDVPANFSSNIASVSAGSWHTCAVTTTGRLGCWGYNYFGQIDVPANFSSNIASVSAGLGHTCAVTTTGRLGCWGYNDNGQIDVPANFSSNIASVSTGGGHTCAIATTGRLGCWGYNDDGQIDVPANFSSNIASVSAGNLHTCAVTTTGRLGCWGDDEYGQLALATISGGFQAGTVAVDAGYSHTCAVRQNGALRCTGGFNESSVPQLYRTLTDNSGFVSPRPPPVTFCKGCVAVGWFHTCAVTTTGKLGCWGSNGYGQIDVPANFNSNIASVSAGSLHTCAVTTTGRLGCWGDHEYGQIDVPANFSTNIASVSAGLGHTCAVTTTGRLGCWGYNDVGQIDVPTNFSSNIASISAGGGHTCAVTTTGRLGCWGKNEDGESTVPANFSSNIASVSAGRHTCAVTTTGRLGCWGYNFWGQTDVPANYSSNIASVSVGSWNHTCAVTTTGKFWCWGNRELSLPASPQFSSDVAAVALLTGGHICVVRLDGAVRCDGANEYGQSIVPSSMYNLLHDRALVPQGDINFGYCPAFCNVDPSKCDNSGICGIDEEDNGACITGYYLTKDGSCGSCDEAYPNCLACVTSGCGTCLSGFYLNTTGACEPCSDRNCQSCPNGVCETCLPYYTKDSDGACVPEDFDCAEGEYLFHCVGEKCNEPGFYTFGLDRECISRFNCDLLYTTCLFDVGVSCKDCCIRVTTDTGKQWYLMRFSDDLLVQCDAWEE